MSSRRERKRGLVNWLKSVSRPFYIGFGRLDSYMNDRERTDLAGRPEPRGHVGQSLQFLLDYGQVRLHEDLWEVVRDFIHQSLDIVARDVQVVEVNLSHRHQRPNINGSCCTVSVTHDEGGLLILFSPITFRPILPPSRNGIYPVHFLFDDVEIIALDHLGDAVPH